jgi:PAS domain S-box-containing protein
MHPRWREPDVAGALPMRGWLAAPLVDRGGQNIGLVQLTDPYGAAFTEQDEALLVQLAQLASVAVENARLIEELASAEAQYRSIFRNALEGIVRCTGAGALLAANPSFAYLLGFRDLPTLLLSVHSFAEVFEDPQEWSRLSEFLKRERAVTGYVARLRRADGGAIWAMLSLRSEWLDGNGVIEGMVQDVTDRHESEARVRALNAELEERVAARTRELAESESLQRTLMDVAPQIVWVSARDGEVRYFNRRWHEVTARLPEESLGWGWLDSVHPDDVAPIRASWAEAITRAGRFELACRIRHADGSYRHYLYVAHPVLDRDGSVGHWVGVSADVSDLKDAEEALAQSNRELEAFSYSVSHDLRTPLHAIAGFSGALLRSYRERLDRDAVHYLERISANCARMAQQIEEILNLARVSRVELRRQPVNLSALAEQCVRNLQSASPGREPQVLIQPGLIVEGDPALLRLVIENLLGNAWKFTAKRADARIELRGTRRPGEQCFSVCDNGVGFDMAYAGKLFGVFQRLHHVSEFPGTGVGLATVRRIIERHRGRVWADAAPGQGACFYFTLPVA